MVKRKKPKIEPPTPEELARTWALTPFLMTELFFRAKNGNRVALSIIKSAEARMKASQFQSFLSRIM